MRFPELAISRFVARPECQNTRAMHRSNPTPFSLSELKSLIELDELDTDQALGYCPDEGLSELRQAIQSWLNLIHENGVLSCAGAQEAIFIAFQALLKPGDQVGVFTPVFDPLWAVPHGMGCQLYALPLNLSLEQAVDFNALEDRLKQGLDCLVMNFPHNPTGLNLPLDDFHQIIQLCEHYHCRILSDEVFRGLEKEPRHRLPAAASLSPLALSIGVVSKAFATPGIRVGWLACEDTEVINKALQIKSYLSICNSLLDEQLASQIITQAQPLLARSRKIIDQNQSLFEQLAPELPISPGQQNACTRLIPLPTEVDSETFCLQLAKNQNILVLPSTVFHMTKPGFRLGFGDFNFAELLPGLLSGYREYL